MNPLKIALMAWNEAYGRRQCFMMSDAIREAAEMTWVEGWPSVREIERSDCLWVWQSRRSVASEWSTPEILSAVRSAERSTSLEAAKRLGDDDRRMWRHRAVDTEGYPAPSRGGFGAWQNFDSNCDPIRDANNPND